MKSVVILSLCSIALAAEFYRTPKDTTNPQTLVDNEVEIKQRLDCFLDKRPCTGASAAYRKIAVEAVKESCAKCTTEHKVLLRAFLQGVKQKFPEGYKELSSKYDPSGTQFKTLEKAIGLI